MKISVLKISSLARQSTLMALLATSWPLSARCQTSPDLTLPDTSAPVVSIGESLMTAGFDKDVVGVVAAQTADKLTIARGTDERKSGSGALHWTYTLDGEIAPRLSVDAAATGPNATALIKLDTARSVRFWLKTNAPTAVSVFFEEAQAPNAKNEPVRYLATVWSAGGNWTEYELSRDRFAPEISAADEANAGRPVLDWSRVARFGMQDTTNSWLKASGQVRVKGARQLWLDDFRVSSGEAANAPILVSETLNPAPQPAPAPVAPANPEENVAGENELPLEDDTAMLPGEEGRDDMDGNTNAPDGGEFAGEGDIGNEGGADEGDGAAPVAPPLRVNQDDRGDARIWIPINGSTESADGLKWSYTRLANRVSALIGPVNPLWMKQFPLGLIRPGEKLRGPKLLLMFEIKTQKPTRLNIAVVERGGATYSKTVPVAARVFRQRISVALSDLTMEQTRRDANGQIDLDRIQSVTLSDVGAQSGIAGPNVLTLFSATWMY